MTGTLCTRLRGLVQDCLDKHMHTAAVFYADKLATFSGGARDDIFLLAQVYFASKQHRRALQLLRRGEFISSDVRFKYLAAQCLLECKQYEECLTLLGEEASEDERSDPKPQDELGREVSWTAGLCVLRARTYEALNNRPRARASYQAAIKQDSYCYDAYYALIQGHMLTCEEEAALIQDLHLHPDDQWLGLLLSIQGKKYKIAGEVEQTLSILEAPRVDTAGQSETDPHDGLGQGEEGCYSPEATDTPFAGQHDTTQQQQHARQHLGAAATPQPATSEQQNTPPEDFEHVVNQEVVSTKAYLHSPQGKPLHPSRLQQSSTPLTAIPAAAAGPRGDRRGDAAIVGVDGGSPVSVDMSLQGTPAMTPHAAHPSQPAKTPAAGLAAWHNFTGNMTPSTTRPIGLIQALLADPPPTTAPTTGMTATHTSQLTPVSGLTRPATDGSATSGMDIDTETPTPIPPTERIQPRVVPMDHTHGTPGSVMSTPMFNLQQPATGLRTGVGRGQAGRQWGGDGGHMRGARGQGQPVGSRGGGGGDGVGCGLQGNLDVEACRADMLYHRGQYEAAYRLTSQLLQDDPYALQVLPVHIHCCCILGRQPELFQLGHRLTEQYPDKAVSWLAVGCYYLCAQQFEAARRHLAQATTLEGGTSAAAWVAYAHAFSALGERDQAMAAYRMAYRLFPGLHTPLLGMGMEYAAMNNLQLAERMLRAAHELCQWDAATCHELACVLYRMGMYKLAASALSTALRAAVCQAEGHTVPVKKINEKESDDYMAPSEVAHRRLPVSCEPIVVALAHALRRDERTDEAMQWYRIALDILPGQAGTYTSLGLCYQIKEDIKQAVEMYHAALALKPDEALTISLLSEALIKRSGDPFEDDIL